jgi:hypothetical protein
MRRSDNQSISDQPVYREPAYLRFSNGACSCGKFVESMAEAAYDAPRKGSELEILEKK